MIQRVAGSLASRADVDILLAEGGSLSTEANGGLRVLKFPTTSTGAHEFLIGKSIGHADEGDLPLCNCVGHHVADRWRILPQRIKEELIRGLGGDSEALFDYLSRAEYDVFVFAGFRPASTVFGMSRVPRGRKIVLLPLARATPILDLDAFDEVFARPENILVLTDTERDLVAARAGGGDRITNIGFALKVHEIAADTVPPDHTSNPYVLFVKDWHKTRLLPEVLRKSRVIAAESDLEVVLTGRGWETLPTQQGLYVRRANSRADVWRWMARAVCLIDPEPNQLLGREVLETMMGGTPIVVASDGGAAQEHAEAGNGGLWYSNSAELKRAVEELRSDSLRETMGHQGRDYSQESYADPEGFIERVARAVL